MISVKKVNHQKVKKIYIPKQDKRPIKGFDICEEVYANIFLCARKKSGKTCALFKIMKECAIKRTIIYVFCSTVYKDLNWIEIRKYFEKKGMEIHIFTSIYEDGQDQLLNLLNDLRQEAKEKEEDEEDKKYGGELEEPEIDKCDAILEQLKKKMHNYGSGKEKRPIEEYDENIEDKHKEKRKKESKYQAPEYMLVFDDLSSELKSPSLLGLMKFNRHFKSKLIISSQWIHDLLPESRKQLDLILIFKGFPEKKMKLIYEDCDSAVPFETFYKIYKKSTKKSHSFMYIDTRSDTFRCNFDKQFVIKRDSDDDDNNTTS